MNPGSKQKHSDDTFSMESPLKRFGMSPLKDNGDKKKKKSMIREQAGYTKQEHASDNRKLARATYPKAKKKKGETAEEKKSRKDYNKQRRKEIRKSGRSATGDDWGTARNFLH